MGPTNEETSGQEKRLLPSKEKWWLSGPALGRRCARGRSVCQTEIVAFAEQPVIVCETFLVGEDIFSSDISNLASKDSEWLSMRALQTVVVVDFGSWVRVPPWWFESV